MGIYITKKTKYLAYINISNAVLNICLNFILISRYGIWGAAFATLICFIYKVSITYFISNSLYKITFEVIRLIKMAGLAAAIYIACIHIAMNSVYLDLSIKFAIACCFPLLLFLLKFYTEDEKVTIFKGIRQPKLVLASIFGKQATTSV